MQPTLISGEWLSINMRKEFDRYECYFYSGYQKKEKKNHNQTLNGNPGDGSREIFTI